MWGIITQLINNKFMFYVYKIATLKILWTHQYIRNTLYPIRIPTPPLYILTYIVNSNIDNESVCRENNENINNESLEHISKLDCRWKKIVSRLMSLHNIFLPCILCYVYTQPFLCYIKNWKPTNHLSLKSTWWIWIYPKWWCCIKFVKNLYL